MANNRIYIRCKGCGEALFLGKTYLSGYFWDAYGGPPLHERLNQFYDKHTYCRNPKVTSVPYDEEIWPIENGYEYQDGEYEIVYETGRIGDSGKKHAY